jgi:hypothetical protein
MLPFLFCNLRETITMSKQLICVIGFLLIALTASAQIDTVAPPSGILKGKITDKSTSAPVKDAIIKVTSNGMEVANGVSGENGEYTIRFIPGGIYRIIASMPGYEGKEISGVMVALDKTTYVDIPLTRVLKKTKVKLKEVR